MKLFSNYFAYLVLATLIPKLFAGDSLSLDTSKVDALVANYADSGNFMGVVLVAKGDRVLLERAYGVADRKTGRRLRIDTPFQIASLSKAFTASAIMHLVEKGRLHLEAPLSRYLPNYPSGDQITLHHLLIHSSGIPNINSLEDYGQWERQSHSAASLIEKFRNLPLQFEPGSEDRYSNSNYVLLARLIELKGEATYGAYLNKNFFAPLGMTQTGHPARERDIPEGMALGYRDEDARDLVQARALNWTVKTGNGSLYSTARDQFIWARALLGDKVLEAKTLEKMFTNHLNHRGYGWFVRERLGRKAIYLNGRSPGYTSYMGIFPKDDLVVVVLANTYMPIATSLGLDLAALALKQPRPTQKLQESPLSAKDVTSYLGAYQFGGNFYQPNQILTVNFENGYLRSDWGALIARDAAKGAFIQRRYWSDIEFIRDQKGTVVAMKFDGHEGRRLEREP